MRRKIKYINNYDLVREINKSKMSYCSILDNSSEYINYDLIITKTFKDEKKTSYLNPSLQEIHQNINLNIEIAIDKRVKRINSLMIKNIQKALNITPKKAEEIVGDKLITSKDISLDDLVFRVVTYEHIPEGSTDNNTLHFIPFKHYKLKNGHLVEVARSHWEGDFETGCFNPDLGSISRPLSKMLLKLAEKYSNKGNFRGYSYREEMVSNALVHLSKSCLLFDEAKVGDNLNPFAYLTQFCTNAFKAILNNEKKNRDMRDDLLIENGLGASSTRQIEIELGMKK